MARAGKAKKAFDPEKQVRKLTTPEMRQHGDYEAGHTKLEGAIVPVVINRGGTAIDRWIHAGGWSEGERRAVGVCIALWARIDRRETPLEGFGMPKGLWMGEGEQNARDRLHGYQKRIPGPYWQVWENVLRWNMPAGTAGGDMEDTPQSSRAAAKTICKFVASLIAMWEGL